MYAIRNHIFNYCNMTDSPPMQIADKADYVYKSDYVYIISGMYRPGAATFMTRLEYEHFSPDNKELQDQFTIYMTQHQGKPYAVIGVPMEHLETCQRLAESLKMQLLQGSPVGIQFKKGEDKDGKETDVECKPTQLPFPIDHSPDLTYTLQNLENIPENKVKSRLKKELIKLETYLQQHQSSTQ